MSMPRTYKEKDTLYEELLGRVGEWFYELIYDSDVLPNEGPDSINARQSGHCKPTFSYDVISTFSLPNLPNTVQD